MKGYVSMAVVTGVLAFGMAAGGCVQMPTESQTIADLRPQIVFKADGARARGARVLVDGLDMGVVGDYLEGWAALRVLSGTHSLQILAGDDVLLEERIYLGDGATRSFAVK